MRYLFPRGRHEPSAGVPVAPAAENQNQRLDSGKRLSRLSLLFFIRLVSGQQIV